MQPEEWSKIKSVFNQILDLSEDEYESFLANYDQNIRSEVRELLKSHKKAENFIAEPALVDLGITDDILIGKQIDNYRIIEKIGAGGMGNVYLAERLNSDFKQKVALKIIKRGMDSEAIIKRFATERKILSRLKHPNIAELLDGGISSEGQPYFVMEFIDGKSVTAYCRENNVSLEKRLKIFRQISLAVEYAHRNLIIHRDLKPSNILVTNEGIPKLLDFGIAKLLSDEESEITITQNKIFTPEYASPEQILSKPVTTSADTYSLGIILYEILSGGRPYQTSGKTYDEIVKIVCDSPITRPSEAITKTNSFETQEQNIFSKEAKSISGDLDNIVLKTLRKEPAERYGSVQQLAEDIERYLKGLPVLARPQTLKYRFEKYVKRHKAGVLAAGLVLVSLIGGTSIATWQAITAKRAQNHAEMRFNQVREIANTVLFDYYDKVKELPGTIELRQKMVSDTVKYLDNLAAEDDNYISLKRELVKAYDKVSEVQFGLVNGNIGDSSGALESAKKALELAKQVAESPDSNLEDLQILGDMYISVAGGYGETGDLAADVEYKKKAIEIYEKIYSEKPDDVTAENNLAKGYFYIATPMKFIGDSKGAIENLQKSALMYEKLSQQVPNDPKYIRNIALSYKYLSPLYIRESNFEEALKISQKSVEIDESRLKTNPSDFQIKYDLSRSYFAVAESLTEEGNLDQAEEFSQKSLDLVKEVSQANPKNFYYQDSTAIALKNFAEIKYKQKQFSKAQETIEEAIKLWEITINRDQTDVFSRAFLADGYRLAGEISLSLSEKQIQISAQQKDILKAQEFFNKSEKLWNELKPKTHLYNYYSNEIEKNRQGIEKCKTLAAGKN